MAEFDTRDRWVMLGLVALGLLTVAAAVVSGRSALNYTLEVEASDAAHTWGAETDQQMRQAFTGVPSYPQNEAMRVLAPELLRQYYAAPGKSAPAISTAKLSESHYSFANRIHRFTGGFMNIDTSAHEGSQVSKLDGFAILSPKGQVAALGGSLEPAAFASVLENGSVKGSFAKAVAEQRLVLSDIPGKNRQSLAFVPVSQDGAVSYVYAFDIDQSSAAGFTNLALIVVTATTSLLIIMGFTVPAAIAARRIRERWQAEDKIRHLALHDSLTGLPNRLQFQNDLESAIARAKRHGTQIAVMGLDLDRFKNVNDTLGHATGDALLEEVAARLVETIRETDVVGRMGGDEFAIVAENITSPEDAIRLARRLCAALAAPYKVNGHDVTTSTSVGIAFGPGEPVQKIDVLMKNADLALYRAKKDGRNTFRFFEPAMDAALQRRRKLENDLRNAIHKKQLYLDYQPQFGLSDGELTGYEALVRWWHPTEGEIPPSAFLPIAEETGLIAPLGVWIMKTACEYAQGWPPEIKLAVNLSSAQFRTQDVYSMVRRALVETGLDPERLELEITEQTVLQNTDDVIATLTKLNELGVSIAMDDFGTGYSSLSYLTRFPVKKIKIDRSFVQTLGANPQTSAVVSSIVGLGQSLNVTITAEGVETEDQAEMLKGWGCDQVQGYFYGRPESEVPMDSLNVEPLDRTGEDPSDTGSDVSLESLDQENRQVA